VPDAVFNFNEIQLVSSPVNIACICEANREFKTFNFEIPKY